MAVFRHILHRPPLLVAPEEGHGGAAVDDAVGQPELLFRLFPLSRQFDLVQGKAQIASHLIEEGHNLVILGKTLSEGYGEHTIDASVLPQAAAQGGVEVILFEEGAVRALFTRSLQDHRLLVLQGQFHAARYPFLLEDCFELGKAAVHAGGSRLQHGFVVRSHQRNPGSGIARCFVELLACPFDETVGVFFFYDQLVDVADGQEHLPDMLHASHFAGRPHEKGAVLPIKSINLPLPKSLELVFSGFQPFREFLIAWVLLLRHPIAPASIVLWKYCLCSKLGIRFE